MSDIITIFEDYKQNISEYKEHFSTIEEFKTFFGEQNLVLETDGSIQVKRYVGFFQKGNTQIQILPKIYSGTAVHKSEVKESLAFMFRLLQLSGYFGFKELDNLNIDTNTNSLLEIFIRIFIEKFNTQFNKTPYFEYVNIVENQQLIKGKILFTENIKKNSYRPHQHIVEFDEFSIDNNLNRLFKYIINELLKKTKDSKNRMLLKQATTMLEDVSNISISAQFFNRIQFTRQNNQYKSLFNFAKLFFFNNQPSINKGNENTFSFLIPLNLLFEKSVLVFLKNIEQKRTNYKVSYQNNKVFGKENGIDVFNLKPDFVISEKNINKTLVVLDTKYKYPFNNDNNPHIKESDLYQLTTYASAHNCNLLFLIYPLFKKSPNSDTLITTYELKTRTIKTYLHILQVDITNINLIEVAETLNDNILSFLT